MAWKPGEILETKGNVKKYMSFIQGAVRAGLGATKTYELMRSMKVSGRYQNTLDAYRAISYAYDNSSVYTPKDYRLKPRSDLIPYGIVSQKRRYSTVVGVNVFNSLDNDMQTRYITIASSELLTSEEYVSLAEEQIPNYEGLESVQEGESFIDRMSYWEAPRL